MKKFTLDNEQKINTGFTVPENYFNDFSGKLLQKLPKEDTKVISLYQKRKKIFFVVAAVLVIALSLPIYMYFFATTQELDPQHLENYLAYQTNITDYDLISEIETDELFTTTEPIITDKIEIENHLLLDGNLEQLIINNQNNNYDY